MRILLVALGILGSQWVEAETPCSDDLKNGRFQKILTHPKKFSIAETAWANFYLISDPGTYDLAMKAHREGDIRGSFILLKCHRGGIGVKKDDEVKSKLNFDIRTKLEKIETPNAIENYMLAYLLPGNASGIVVGNNPDKMVEEEAKGRNSRWFHLNASANAGFAQAMDEVGLAMQRHDEQRAFAWYKKAAQAGLAAGMKNLGFLYAMSPQLKDPELASTWTRRAAQAGDIYGMVNMGAFVDKKVLDNVTLKEAQSWINKAEKTGHSLGYLEKGLALLTGNYQFAVDRKAGYALLQKAVQSGDSFSLSQMSTFYEQGLGVDKSRVKAAEFAEAAYVQGDISAAGNLARIYAIQAADDPSLQERADYWKTRAMSPSLAYAVNLDKKHPGIVKALHAINPFTLQVE